MKRIAIDFDDVIFDFNRSFCEFSNLFYGTNINYEDIREFDYEKVWNISNDELHDRINRYYDSDYHKNAKPIYQANEILLKLKDLNYEFHIITAREERLRSVIETWLKKNLPNIPFVIQFTNAFSKIKGPFKSKSSVCKENGINIMIEDAIHNANELSKNGIKVYLPDRPWNQGKLPIGVERVRDWQEVFTKLNADPKVGIVRFAS